MTRPAVHPTTEDIYARFPALYRDADEQQAAGPSGFPLLRYVSLEGDQVGELEDLLDRIAYVRRADGGDAGDTSDLVDPSTADVAWLPWIGQHVGVVVHPRLNEIEARDAVQFASAGWLSATKDAVGAAAKSELTGTRYVRVYDHQTDVGAGDAFDLLVVTLTSETPSVAAVLDAIERKGAKPSGVRLYRREYEWTFNGLATSYATFDAVLASFATFEQIRTHVPPEELA